MCRVDSVDPEEFNSWLEAARAARAAAAAAAEQAVADAAALSRSDGNELHASGLASQEAGSDSQNSPSDGLSLQLPAALCTSHAHSAVVRMRAFCPKGGQVSCHPIILEDDPDVIDDKVAGYAVSAWTPAATPSASHGHEAMPSASQESAQMSCFQARVFPSHPIALDDDTIGFEIADDRLAWDGVSAEKPAPAVSASHPQEAVPSPSQDDSEMRCLQAIVFPSHPIALDDELHDTADNDDWSEPDAMPWDKSGAPASSHVNWQVQAWPNVQQGPVALKACRTRQASGLKISVMARPVCV